MMRDVRLRLDIWIDCHVRRYHTWKVTDDGEIRCKFCGADGSW